MSIIMTDVVVSVNGLRYDILEASYYQKMNPVYRVCTRVPDLGFGEQ